jgi:two-component system, chemotaxis family, response regulator Rcp1
MTTNHQPKIIDILLVEDSPADVLIAREALKEAKLINTIHVTEDGMEAMEFLNKRGKFASAPRPDLILLDLNLPRKNGREVLEEIKNDANLKSIPVVVLTTSSAEEDILRSYNLHANCYVVKPVEFDSFVKAIQSIQHFWFSIVALPPDKE